MQTYAKVTLKKNSFASSEHAYRYEQCVGLLHKEVAESILSAPTAKEAKSIADGVVHSESTMLKVLQFKSKCH